MRKKIFSVIVITQLLFIGCNYSMLTVDIKKGLPRFIEQDTCTAFWGAVKHLDLYCEYPSLSQDEEEFLRGMRKNIGGYYEEADSIFYRLLMKSQDSIVKQNTREILILHRTDRADWKNLLGIYESLKEEPTGLSRAMQNQKTEEYSLPEMPETLSVKINSYGIPVVDVQVNGRQKKFWLDTGASDVVISSAIAKECAIAAIDTFTENVITATTSVPAAVTVVKQFAVGRFSMNNIPAIIIEKSYAESRLFNVFKQFDIEGIIGWHALKNICLTFDLLNKRIIIERSRKKEHSQKNLLWCEYPLLLLTTPSGDTAKFFFDSGAQYGSAHPDIISRMPELEKSGRVIVHQGIGGGRTLIGESIDRLILFSQNVRITLEAFPVTPVGKSKFVSHDGIIGNDLLKKGTLVMDYPNREFEFIPAQ